MEFTKCLGIILSLCVPYNDNGLNFLRHLLDAKGSHGKFNLKLFLRIFREFQLCSLKLRCNDCRETKSAKKTD